MATKKRKPAKKRPVKRVTAPARTRLAKSRKARNRTVIKARRVTVLSANPARKRKQNKAGHISESDIAKFPSHVQQQLRKQLGKVEEKEAKATTPAQKKAAAKTRRSFLSRLGTRLRIVGQTRKFKVSARDISRAPRKTVKVRARHETDALAKAEAKLGRDYDQFRVVNRPTSKNPSYTVEAIPKYTSTVKQTVQALTRGSAVRKIRRTVPGPKSVYSNRVQKNPKKRSPKVSSKVRQLREKFTGTKSSKTAVMNAPAGTPRNLAKLGKLIAIKAERGTIIPATKNPGSTVWLCADSNGKLHLCTTGERLIDGGPQNFGQVREIEYEAIKPHLGHQKPTVFFHKFGEEGGSRPTLYTDGQGGLKFRGGSYKIESEGIRD